MVIKIKYEGIDKIRMIHYFSDKKFKIKELEYMKKWSLRSTNLFYFSYKEGSYQ